MEYHIRSSDSHIRTLDRRKDYSTPMSAVVFFLCSAISRYGFVLIIAVGRVL